MPTSETRDEPGSDLEWSDEELDSNDPDNEEIIFPQFDHLLRVNNAGITMGKFFLILFILFNRFSRYFIYIYIYVLLQMQMGTR